MSRSDGHAPGNSPFDQPWWLDALAPDSWDEVSVEHDGETVARLPYRIRQRAGLVVVDQPPLTPTLGPWLASSVGKEARRLSAEMHLLEELVRRLPPFDLFVQNFSPTISNWLPFHWAGFEASARCTYRIDDLTDLDAVWGRFASSLRNHVRTAERTLAVRTDLDPVVVVDLYEATLERKGVRRPPRERVVRLLRECDARGQGRAFVAVDGKDRVHAAAYVVWDDRAAYYLVGARDEARADRGATSLLLWNAIRHAATATAAFDFEGSMIRSVERYFRGFGARQTPYLHVTRTSRRGRLVLHGRNSLARLRRRSRDEEPS